MQQKGRGGQNMICLGNPVVLVR